MHIYIHTYNNNNNNNNNDNNDNQNNTDNNDKTCVYNVYIYIYMIDGDIKIVCVQVLTKVSACTDVSGSITVSEPNNV